MLCSCLNYIELLLFYLLLKPLRYSKQVNKSCQCMNRDNFYCLFLGLSLGLCKCKSATSTKIKNKAKQIFYLRFLLYSKWPCSKWQHVEDGLVSTLKLHYSCSFMTSFKMRIIWQWRFIFYPQFQEELTFSNSPRTISFLSYLNITIWNCFFLHTTIIVVNNNYY